eukprot:maker-scaffold14_size734282-snap-gene-2.21 protein:Tk11287 transcript:maker-scaffold14_size734282-snap-gene-2.21-mRNA-1 annotation:"choline-phosphate cytidylyltransferase b"
MSSRNPTVAELQRQLLEPAPFDDEKRAQEERDKCDYGIKVTLIMAQEGTAPRKIRIYADGIYDLFHQGHARQLMQVKNLFPKSVVYVLVGCCNDQLTRESKGEPVMDENERYEALRHCRYVDEIVKNAPWSVDAEFLAKHKIDFVAHDDLPYTTGSGVDVYKDLKEMGLFVATQRTEGVSTSDIVTRIIRDYDGFVRRNLDRGVSAKDMNVSMSPRKTTGKKMASNGLSPATTEPTTAVVGPYLPTVAELQRQLLEPAPFDDEKRAQEERDKCDYGIKVTLAMAYEGTAPRKIRIYADGIYDLFHQGHARQLMQVKNLFPKSVVYVLVGCCNDQLTRERKGETVMDESERYEGIRHCRYVDEIVKNAPWSLDDEYLAKHKIDFVAHDELPYTTGSGVDVYKDLKEKGMFVATQRTEGVSTSDIVTRIVRNYDRFVRRNLARGYSAKDLNVSFIRGQKLRFQNKVEDISNQTKSYIEKTRDHIQHTWEDKSKEVIGSFLKIFGGNDWVLDSLWSRSRRSIAKVLHSPNNSEDEGDDDIDDDMPEASTSKSPPTSCRPKRKSSVRPQYHETVVKRARN